MKNIPFFLLFAFALCVAPAWAQNSIISGVITTPHGDVLTGGEVTLLDLQGNIVGTQTLQSGQYNFFDLDDNTDYILKVERDSDPLNGVSTFDMVLGAKNILGLQILDDPYTIIAADVNLTSSITTLDLLIVRRVILQLDQAFPILPAWRFVPTDLNFTNPSDPFADLTGTPNEFTVTTNGGTVNFDVTGIKLGDLNYSVFP